MRKGRLWSGVVLLLGAAILSADQLRRERRAAERLAWPTAGAIVDSTWVEVTSSGTTSMGVEIHRPLARISFEAEGVRYETTTEVTGLGNVYAVSDRLRGGSPWQIRYDPDDPERVHFDTGDVILVYTDLRPLCFVAAVAGLVPVFASGAVPAAIARIRVVEADSPGVAGGAADTKRATLYTANGDVWSE